MSNLFTSFQNQQQKFQNTTSTLNGGVNDDNRFELKYRLNYFQYLKIRNAIRPYMDMDAYTAITPVNRYLVRSLYFDTQDYRAYYQKMNGDSSRVKFRFRTYHREFAETKSIRVELKMRQGNLTSKKNVFVPVEEYRYFILHRHWENVQDPITIEFERQRLIQDLRPIVLIEYEREGYQAKLKSSLRITFDHHIRSAHAKYLFPKQVFFKTHMSKNLILEIKFKDNLPDWLEKLVRAQGLKVVANSKYTQGLQISRYDLYHPNQVILVR